MKKTFYIRTVIVICSIVVIILMGYFINKQKFEVAFIKNILDINATYKENQVLKKHVTNYDKLSVGVKMLSKENEEFQKIIKKKKEMAKYNPISATIIGRSIEEWNGTAFINKGTKDGIKEDMIVITADGMIGRIEQTNESTSSIILISRDERTNRITASLEKDTNVFGMIEGYDDEKNALLFKGIPFDQPVKVDETVVTSDLGGNFPQGLVIGKVQEVIPDEYALTQTIYVSPAANLYDISEVLVLTKIM